ncbi:MAG: hypothetical protein NTY20_02175 [Candidatus Aenigmarchaeota archaeon]|nr:hypothetical protein [Candidatus Aenigmarchaeota archaeon]
MSIFDTLVSNMQNMGLFQFLFPFLLALGIFYGVLYWAIGDRVKKGPVGLISVVLAFFVMLFASSNPGISTFFANLGGMTLVVGSGILVIAILLGLAGFKLQDTFKGKYMMWFLVFAIILIGLIVYFGAGGGNFVSVPSFFISSDFTTVIIVIVIIAAAMWFMTQGEGEEKKDEKAGGGKTS